MAIQGNLPSLINSSSCYSFSLCPTYINIGEFWLSASSPIMLYPRVIPFHCLDLSPPYATIFPNGPKPSFYPRACFFLLKISASLLTTLSGFLPCDLSCIPVPSIILHIRVQLFTFPFVVLCVVMIFLHSSCTLPCIFWKPIFQ